MIKKNQLIAFFLLTFRIICISQTNEVKLNQLLAPSSPAFNLLGISPETIERPTNPTDFALSLNNASQNLSFIPSNYAIEVAPFWLINKRNMKWADFVGNKLGPNLQQSAVISIGTTTTTSKIDSSVVSQMAIGFKVSFLRGKTTGDYEHWQISADSVFNLVNIDSRIILDDLKKKDKLYQEFISETKDSTKSFEIQKEFKRLADEHIKLVLAPQARELTRKIKKDSIRTTFIGALAQSTNFIRIGWKLDLAGGLVFDFPSNSFYNQRTSKAALWLTGGYDNPKKASILFTFRSVADYYSSMLNESGQVISNINATVLNLDAGMKFIYNLSEKCYFSFEGISRNPFVSSKEKFKANKIPYSEKTERWTVSVNYNAADNQNISFTYGKNFDNLQSNKQSLIAYLTYIIGIGSARNID